MVTLSETPWAFATGGLTELVDRDLYRDRREFEHRSDAVVRVGDRELVDFASNDYLGLASATSGGRSGAGSAALVSGRSRSLAALENTLAEFEQQAAALVFPTGYAANLGVVAALGRKFETVFVDKLNHSCLVEGAKLAGTRWQVYRSDRLDRLRERLDRDGRPSLIVTDGVFSMDGTLAPLPELVEIAEATGSGLIVDEAHATGVFGDGGRGSCEHFGIRSPCVIRTGTLSKAIGGLGGFVTGPRPLIDWLRHHARTQMFSTALPPVLCEHAVRAIEMVSADPDRRLRVHRLADRLREKLSVLGSMRPPSIGPIVPIIVGSPAAATATARTLERVGFLVGCIRPPTVPNGTSRLRISVSAAHSDSQIDRLAAETVAAISDLRPTP